MVRSGRGEECSGHTTELYANPLADVAVELSTYDSETPGVRAWRGNLRVVARRGSGLRGVGLAARSGAGQAHLCLVPL